MSETGRHVLAHAELERIANRRVHLVRAADMLESLLCRKISADLDREEVELLSP